ncbi:MAG: polyketide cyclase / dehydrase and lipid transport [Nocardiaceae bacterium]|nr:polyketide cyclase / dehydrase and lipid transport [Nocardiaceae bacterium]
MSSIQVSDQMFIAAPGEVVARALAAPNRWRGWWPKLSVSVREDRGAKGVRWIISGELDGTMEVWLEPMLDGVIVHYFVHAEPTSTPVNLVALNRKYRVSGKEMSFELKKEIEAGRPAGIPPAPVGV